LCLHDFSEGLDTAVLLLLAFDDFFIALITLYLNYLTIILKVAGYVTTQQRFSATFKWTFDLNFCAFFVDVQNKFFI
jgi:hypothetical protein